MTADDQLLPLAIGQLQQSKSAKGPDSWEEQMPADIEKPILIVLGVYVVIGLIVTRGIVLDTGLTILQKVAQFLIIWLIPVFGMCFVLLMQGNNHTRSEMKDLVPFPFYLVAHSRLGDGSLAGFAQDGVGEHCGTDAADGD